MIGGCRRGVGKTAFICALIERLGSRHGIVAVKVTTVDCFQRDHGREPADSALYHVTEETDPRGDGDTSRMLASGARRALWLQAPQAHLQDGIDALLDALGRETASVWESTRACRLVEPGAFIMIEDSQTTCRKPWTEDLMQRADRIVPSDGVTFDIDWNDIQSSGGRWTVKMDATAILLAGGDSTRMGVDKALLPIDGKPMIQRIHEQVRPWFSRILISSNNASAHAFLGVPIVADEAVGDGPLMGIVSALRASPNEVNFVTACDTPDVDIDLMRALVRQAHDCDAVVPRAPSGRPEPLFAVYNKSVLPAFEQMLSSGHCRMADALAQCRVNYVPVEEGQIPNINTMSEYRQHFGNTETKAVTITGSIRAISISERKGVSKTNVADAQLQRDHGLVGDAHAGPWHRQVSLLAAESIEKMAARGARVSPGDFAENITTEGIDLSQLSVGSRLKLGDAAVLEITQFGKQCHSRCAIYSQVGDCIMPRDGVFAKVVKPGRIRVGDPIKVCNDPARSASDP
jgi:molybdopterin-guanine dinucleotide biosynthesis protein A/MOSC domain-containing protein YiiM